MIEQAIDLLAKGCDLKKEQMQEVMEEMMAGKIDTPQMVDFLVSLSNKGETADELTAAVQVMRKHSVKIKTKGEIILDTCGTGADKQGTFNISTVAAFVVSGCGIRVAKHGNRAVSSSCGSADVLEVLGVNIQMSQEKIEKCLDEIGIAFLFAPNLHPAMKFAAAARKQIGKRTIFNLLGPLSNPAGVRHQLVGVYDKRWLEPVAGVLANLGTRHALVVHGEDGLDEITTTASTIISEVYRGKLSTYKITPEDFGFPKAGLTDLAGKDASLNAKILLEVLNGSGGLKKDIVLFNAGAAIFAADKASSIKEGIALARVSIDAKKALEKLELLKAYSLK